MQLKKLALLCVASLGFSATVWADINVGVTLSSTGPAASLGIPERNTISLLPTTIGGQKVNYIVLDDASDTTAAVGNTRKLISESKVDVILAAASPRNDYSTALETARPHLRPDVRLLRLEFPPAGALAFTIACGFIADTASLPLVVSNLVNIVTANYFGVSFDRYAAVMVPVNLVSVAATLLVLWLWFRRDIPARYAVDELETPQHAIRDPVAFRAAFPLLALLLVAYFVTGPLGVPIALITGAAALVLMAIAGRWASAGRGATVALGKVLRGAPWQIVLFSLGMYLVVYGLGNAWLTEAATSVLTWLAAQGTFVATIGTGFAVAILASVMNNLPATLVGALAIDAADVPALTRELMIYANVVGNDLGPKFTPIGSLATLLWLHVLAGKGQRITWGQYMKVGLILTPPVLLAALVALWIWLPLAH